MARTRIIIGHPAQAGSQPPFIVYLGTSGADAEAAIKADTQAHRYEIFEGPGRRKNNAAYQATAALQPASLTDNIQTDLTDDPGKKNQGRPRK